MIQRLFFILMFIFAASLVTQTSSAAVLEVPEDFFSIGEALRHSEPGDQVHVAPGQYFEYNLILPLEVSLIGMGLQPENVIINALNQGRILVCENLTDRTVVQNITFINGVASGDLDNDKNGGAILLNNSSLSLINCRFINNSAARNGGALRCTHSSPQISNCYFEENAAPEGGGGAIDCSYNSSLTLENCFFQFNSANWGGALSCRGESSPLISNSIFSRNEAAGSLGYGGAALADFGALALFENCTFFANEARYGGALACFEDSKTDLQGCTLVSNSCQWMGAGLICSKSFPVIESSIIAFQNGVSISCGGSALPMISCTNIFGSQNGDWTGVIEAQLQTHNNMSVDPLFCDLNSGLEYVFNLQDESPCADEESFCSVIGAWPTGCDITPIYVNDFSASWSNGSPQISWQTQSQRSPDEFVLLRSFESQMEEPQSIPFQISENGWYVALDLEYSPGSGQELIYQLHQREQGGSLVLISQASLSDLQILKPLHLSAATPNPFNPSTTFSFETSTERLISVKVHNVRGQLIKELAHRQYPAGKHELQWNGIDGFGRRQESGTYIIILQADGMIRSQKVMLLK